MANAPVTALYQGSGTLSACTSPGSQRKRIYASSEDRAAHRRLRRRVDPSQRKRVAAACQMCKRRKQKCDGEQPCHICRLRNDLCVFLRADRRSESQPEIATQSSPRQLRHSNVNVTAFRHSGSSASESYTDHDEEIVSVGEGNSHLLLDPRGHFRFIGKSGAHCFIEQIRHLFRETSGESPFTQDVERFMLADGPAHTHSERTLQLPSRALANELVDIFEERVQPFSYVFHMDDCRQIVDDIYANPLECPPSHLCLIHLTFALASATSAQVDARRFFESGLGLCTESVEDGDFWCVQAPLLISLYYHMICKRNAFWIALGGILLRYAQFLGISIRFGQALGIHQASALQTLPPRERLLRQRVWRTLYTHDRFHSAALGRPAAIQDGDWDDDESDNATENARLQIQMTRIARLQGDICQQVYRPRTISSEAASSLARRLQQWSDELPAEFRIDSLIKDTSRAVIERHALGRLHMAHLNSVILLTRPFFFYVVTTAVSNHPASAKTARNGTVVRLANACLLSATRLVDMVHTFIITNARPARPPFLPHFLLMAGLVLLLDAYRCPANLSNSAVANVTKIMSSYANQDPSAKRYSQILELMESAIRRAKHDDVHPTNLLSELLSGFPSEKVEQQPHTGKSPGDISLSQFLNDTPLGMDTNLEVDPLNFDFDFDSNTFWEMMKGGADGEFDGVL